MGQCLSVTLLGEGPARTRATPARGSHSQCRLRHLRRLRWRRSRSNERSVLAQCIRVRASVRARTRVGGSDGMAQAAGPGTGDPYVRGPGIKAIGLAASPGAGYPGASNFGTGVAGQVLVANAVWARAGVSASRSPFHFLFLFPFSPLI